MLDILYLIEDGKNDIDFAYSNNNLIYFQTPVVVSEEPDAEYYVNEFTF